MNCDTMSRFINKREGVEAIATPCRDACSTPYQLMVQGIENNFDLVEEERDSGSRLFPVY